MFGRLHVRALAGPHKDIQRLVPKALLCCLGCVFRVVVLLEGEHSPQSEAPSTLEQVLIKELCTFAPFIFTSILTTLPVPSTENHPHSTAAATTMLHRRGGTRFPPEVLLEERVLFPMV